MHINSLSARTRESVSWYNKPLLSSSVLCWVWVVGICNGEIICIYPQNYSKTFKDGSSCTRATFQIVKKVKCSYSLLCIHKKPNLFGIAILGLYYKYHHEKFLRKIFIFLANFTWNSF